MVSVCNFLERNYQILLVRLLQCRESESALIVSRERRGFGRMVDLVEELFAVYVIDPQQRQELKDVGTIAKKLYEERNKHVHSIWFFTEEQTTIPAARRYKGGKNPTLIKVKVSELAALVDKFDKCSEKILEITDRQHFS